MIPGMAWLQSLLIWKVTLYHIRLNICIQKTKFSSHNQYLFGLLFSRNAKKTCTDQSILWTLLLGLKRNASQTFKSKSCKNVFPKSVYHWYNFVPWMFFIPCDNWNTFFLYKFIITHRFGWTAMLLCSLKQVFWKKFNIKGTVKDMIYFARSKFSRSLVHKKNFSLIWQVVFKLWYAFCQER